MYGGCREVSSIICIIMKIKRCSFEQDMKDALALLPSADFSLLWGKALPVPHKQGSIFRHMKNWPELWGLTFDEAKEQLTMAMGQIQDEVYPLFLQYTSDINKAQLIWEFTDNTNKNLPKKFDEGTLARAYAWYWWPYQWRMYFNNKIHWWFANRWKQQSLRKVWVHEILHLLWLWHSEVKEDVMRPFNLPENIINITEDTKLWLEKIYWKIVNPIRVKAKILLTNFFPSYNSVKRLWKSQLIIVCLLLWLSSAHKNSEDIAKLIRGNLNSQK